MRAIFRYGIIKFELDIPFKNGQAPYYYAIPKPIPTAVGSERLDVYPTTSLVFVLNDSYDDKIAWYEFESEK